MFLYVSEKIPVRVQIGCWRTFTTPLPLHLAGHSPQSAASAQSTSHFGTQHWRLPEYCSHPASHRPAAAPAWHLSGQGS